MPHTCAEIPDDKGECTWQGFQHFAGTGSQNYVHMSEGWAGKCKGATKEVKMTSKDKTSTQSLCRLTACLLHCS